MDYLEVMDFCGFDLEKSAEMAENLGKCPDWVDEALNEAGLEKVSAQSVR